jgi:hypothetical protein
MVPTRLSALQIKCLMLISLLIGAEAARVATHLEGSLLKQLQKHAERRDEEIQENGGAMKKEHLEQEIAMLETSHALDPYEFARGKLEYAIGKDVTTFKSAFVVVLLVEGGVALKVHDADTVSERNFFGKGELRKSDFKVPATYTVFLRHDSLVEPADDLGGLPGVKVYGKWNNQPEDSWGSFRVDLTRQVFRVRSAHGRPGEWLAYTGENGGPPALAEGWLNMIRYLQAVRTGVLVGEKLMQCTKIPDKDMCNSPDFCVLVGSGAGAYCQPQAALKGFEAFERRSSSIADRIEKRGCVANCVSDWGQATQDIQVATFLRKQLKAFVNGVPKGPVDGPTVTRRQMMHDIAVRVDRLETVLIQKLSDGFDKSRGALSWTSTSLTLSGCRGLAPGSMKVLLRMKSSNPPTAEEASSVVTKCGLISKVMEQGGGSMSTRLKQLQDSVMYSSSNAPKSATLSVQDARMIASITQGRGRTGALLEGVEPVDPLGDEFGGMNQSDSSLNSLLQGSASAENSTAVDAEFILETIGGVMALVAAGKAAAAAITAAFIKGGVPIAIATGLGAVAVISIVLGLVLLLVGAACYIQAWICEKPDTALCFNTGIAGLVFLGIGLLIVTVGVIIVILCLLFYGGMAVAHIGSGIGNAVGHIGSGAAHVPTHHGGGDLLYFPDFGGGIMPDFSGLHGAGGGVGDALDPDGRRRAQALALAAAGVAATAPLWSKTKATWTKEQLDSRTCVRRVVDKNRARFGRRQADCFQHCSANGKSTGTCDYCGSDAVCCKLGHDSDPPICQQVVFWPSGPTYHTCVPRSRSSPIYSLMEVEADSQLSCSDDR